VGAIVLVVSVVLLFAAFRLGAYWFGGATTVMVLRHAEKSAEQVDPSLSPAGRERAARLARLLAQSGVAAIYVSDTRRARETGTPLAERLGIKLIEYPGREVDELAERLLERHRGRTVVVIGHSNTLPALLAKLSRGRYVTRVDEDEFDGLYLVSVNRFDPPAVRVLRY